MPPAVASTPPRWDAASVRFRHPILPSPYGSGLGPRILTYRGHNAFTLLRPGNSWSPQRRSLSMGFRILVSLHPAIQTTGLLTLAPAGLSPAEHTSLYWTHFRTAGFPQYGWKAGFSGGVFPHCCRFKPAPGVHRQPSGLRSPFVHLIVTAVVPHYVGPWTRLRTALEVITPPPQGPSLGSGL